MQQESWCAGTSTVERERADKRNGGGGACDLIFGFYLTQKSSALAGLKYMNIRTSTPMKQPKWSTYVGSMDH